MSTPMSIRSGTAWVGCGRGHPTRPERALYVGDRAPPAAAHQPCISSRWGLQKCVQAGVSIVRLVRAAPALSADWCHQGWPEQLAPLRPERSRRGCRVLVASPSRARACIGWHSRWPRVSNIAFRPVGSARAAVVLPGCSGCRVPTVPRDLGVPWQFCHWSPWPRIRLCGGQARLGRAVSIAIGLAGEIQGPTVGP